MNPKAVYKYCKHLGCCEACCLRYIGIKNPDSYEHVDSFVTIYQDEADKPKQTFEQNEDLENGNDNSLKPEVIDKNVTNGDSDDLTNLPPCKKRRIDVCISCLGVLQEDKRFDSFSMVKNVLAKKKYECATFACALSAPMATLLRERAITLRLAEEFPGYDDKTLTALKEAWKWSFGVQLAAQINKTLDSGAVSPLLVTLNYDYADDMQELEILKQVSPQLFEERSKQKRRFVTEFTRRSVEQALATASLAALQAAGGGLPTASVRALCVGMVCAHAPMYLAGRYIKLSRNLPQSPWILDKKRVLPSSVQEIIYKPLADFYNMDEEEADRRLKLIAAGREDVDVRCLGEGRPFAVEITDPTRQLTADELAKACQLISESKEVIVKQIVPITREDLVQLKKGEETKSKTYEALCIKLSHSQFDDVSPDSPVKVTPEDIARINSFRNTPQNSQNSLNNKSNDHNDSNGDTSDEENNANTLDANGDSLNASPDSKTTKTDIQNTSEENQMAKNSSDAKDIDATPEKNYVQVAEAMDTSLNSEKCDNLSDVKIVIEQKTPIRVLHRRPLLTRTRQILELEAEAVPGSRRVTVGACRRARAAVPAAGAHVGRHVRQGVGARRAAPLAARAARRAARARRPAGA
ncbi:tRNA pseudouridine synthase Pus10 isoform X2 [Bicyclus anynana]|uniref:tRNA pseudouridine(55) synthase n=2 Tax=Bicyclus anynana TaxID=110368 RepID=A0ABM3LIZ0_BICAN|nr:tRNA pseudouridine synthase Pus10 isoform X2 [Bicyclus anynana]